MSITEARTIIQRRQVAPDEASTIREAAIELLSRNKTLSYEDHQIVRFARAVWGGLDEEPTNGVTPFDDDVARLTAEVADAKSEYVAADSAMWSAGQVWAQLVGQDGYAGAGVTMCRLLNPRDKDIEDDGGVLSKTMRHPPSKQSVAVAEDEIKECVIRRGESERRLQTLTSEMNKARATQSRWRVS